MESNHGVSNFKAMPRKIPWKAMLPLLMGAVTVGLHYLDRAWSLAWSRWDHMAESTARGLSVLVNGPGSFFTTGLTLSGQLLGVAIFWTWIGFLVDRRLRGFKTPTMRRTWPRVTVYLIGLALACWCVWSVARFFQPETLTYLSRLPGVFMSNSPGRFMRGRDLAAIAQLAWGFGYMAYFTRKLWLLWSKHETVGAV